MRRATGWMLAGVAGGLAALGPLTPARAAVIASEDFAYTAGSSIVGQNGGSGWGGAWVNTDGAFGNLTIGASSLSYPGLAAAGGDATSGGNSADGRTLAAVSTSYGNTVWVAFASKFSVSGGGFDNLRFYDNAAIAGGIGGNNNYANWAILDSNLAATTFTTTPLNGATTLALMKIDYSSGTSSLWMNPSLGSFDGSQTPSMTVSFAPVFTDVQLFMRAGTAVDQLTLATTYQQALGESVPEPSALVLLAAGLGMLGVASGAGRKQSRQA